MFGKLTRAFKDEGYQERKHLFGAPYDFRLAADGLEQVCSHAVSCDTLKALHPAFPGASSKHEALACVC